ncbi:phage tail tape measure protein [Peptoniphilus sp. BV3C26]|uniref:phage tail tape measure protein n=1 Tax=Peptoniphilus sp. BV3C26 TaxID=1111134 RepID=UPI0003B8ABE8|nr:phage tail tape measure protein [Peptoniphilus sp. BV3C26]ERT57746.1 tail tape measure protein, TIGR01760-like family protein [Peptoniphilus sp. BV3C26]
MAGNIKGITIEIGGDTTKLDKALKDVNKSSRDLNKELRDIEKSLKFNPGNTDLVAQKQRVLAESVENTKKKLETLKEAQEQAKKALAEGKIGQDEYDALTREIIKTENQLKSLQGELDKTNSKWKDVGDKLQSAGDKMAKVGEGMTKGVTAPIAAVAGLSIAAFKEVDNGLDTVISKTGATGEAAKSLEESFRNVAGNMPASFDEVGNAIGEINTQFGLTGEELEKASEKMIKFAQINGADVTNSTINAKQAIEKYGLSAKDLDMVLDSVTKTAQNTGVSTDRLFDVVIKGSPQLKELGLNFAQATEMMGRMEQKGIDSNKALSYLTRAQTNWAKEGKSVTQGLQEMQEKLASATTHEEKLAIAAEAFGTKGGAFMLEVLESGALNADEFANAMEEAAGSVDSTWEGMVDPIDLVEQAMNNLKMSGADLGTALQTVLVPMLEGAINAFKKFSDWFGKLSPETQQFIVKVGLIAAAIGPVLVAVGKLSGGLGKAISFFSAGGKGADLFAKAIGFITSPAGLVVAAIAAVIAIGVLLYKNWDTIKEKASEIWGAIVDFLSGIWQGISSAWSSAWEGIKSTLTGIWNGLKSVASTAFEGIKQAITTVWNAVKSTTTTIWNGIKTAILAIWNGLKTTATTAFNAIKTAIDTVWNAVKATTSTIWNGIKSAVEGIWNGIKSSAANIFNGLKTTIDGIWEGIKSATTAAWNAIKTAIETPINAAKNTVKSAIDAIKGFFSGLKLEIPSVKLPKLPSPKITGHFSLNPPSAPKLSWYDKGGIFSSPSIIGVGEKRPEFVGALEDLRQLIGDEMDKRSSGGDILITGNNFQVREERDIKKIAEELYKLIKKDSRGRGEVVI